MPLWLKGDRTTYVPIYRHGMTGTDASFISFFIMAENAIAYLFIF